MTYQALPYKAILIEGPESSLFLQKQLSNNIDLLTQEKPIQWSAYCSRKGRVLATLWIYKRESQAYIILTSPELIDFIFLNLEKTIFRTKVQVKLAPSIHLMVYYGLPIEKALENTISLPLLNTHFKISESSFQEQDETSSHLSSWRKHLIQAGIFLIEDKKWQDIFLPQFLNYDVLKIISWNKGCYPGQEIIARLHYLGSCKKRLFLLQRTSSKEKIPENATLYSESGEIIGCLVEEEEGYGLGVLAASISSGTSIMHSSGNFQVEKIPYLSPSPK